jgi:receptor expression-enhancing protein 5/6
MASFQDKAQGHIATLDKEVRTLDSTHVVALRGALPPREKLHDHLLTSNSLQLSKYPLLNNLEKQTSVPKTYAVLGLVSCYFFFIFFNM